MMTSAQSDNLRDPAVLVHAYLDGELSAAESAEAEHAIAASPEFAAEAAAIATLKHALRTRLPPEALPSQLETRIARSVGLQRPAPRPGWMALAASVVIATALSSMVTAMLLRNADDRIFAESVDSHLRSLMAPQPVDVASSERHVVRPWFNGKAVQSPKVPDLDAQGFPLAGGRIDVISATPVPAIVYKRRLHTITVWAATEPLSARLTRERRSINGTNVVVWRSGDITYFAASDLNATELATFASLFAAAP